ncbi:MAG: CDF family Co(II)/Ni(II) efflux transporter DmeF [Elusimicrobia bacterium]|nr:CDF family Co(II)/Ni(II) efflux transporter DmeF [Elusimicrobiota bacterium]
MHTKTIERWAHDHAFGQDKKKSGERRTMIVIGITAVMMTVEIAAGMAFGSMALLADGLHMASHASTLTISAFAYYFTRRHARDARFNFGTGKINSLAAFASATLLAGFALVMVWESIMRLLSPVRIEFGQAILVAVLGLAVNGSCLLILKDDAHEHAHDADDHHEHHGHDHGPADHNLWSAYLHVLADALTSVLAILALLAGRYMGLAWMDPLMGVLGAALVTRWSWQLLRASSRVLLDMQAPEPVKKTIRERIESVDGCRVSDLHVWSVGPAIYAAEIGVVTAAPKEPGHYRKLLPSSLRLVHVTVEVARCEP